MSDRRIIDRARRTARCGSWRRLNAGLDFRGSVGSPHRLVDGTKSPLGRGNTGDQGQQGPQREI